MSISDNKAHIELAESRGFIYTICQYMYVLTLNFRNVCFSNAYFNYISNILLDVVLGITDYQKEEDINV